MSSEELMGTILAALRLRTITPPLTAVQDALKSLGVNGDVERYSYKVLNVLVVPAVPIRLRKLSLELLNGVEPSEAIKVAITSRVECSSTVVTAILVEEARKLTRVGVKILEKSSELIIRFPNGEEYSVKVVRENCVNPTCFKCFAYYYPFKELFAAPSELQPNA